MHGFQHLLTKYLHALQPKHVVEWGPGLSTRIILDESYCILNSIEHSKKYWELAGEQFAGDTRATFHLIDNTCPDSGYATKVFELPPSDFVFVDGRRRVECVLAAFQNLKPGGVVMLHDFSRENYQRMLLPLVEVLEVRDNTIVMQPRPSLVRPRVLL